MGTSSKGLMVAMNLVSIYAQHIGNTALRSVTEFNYKNDEIVIICATYSDLWAEFIDGLNPEAEAIREKGLSPTSICAATIENFENYLKEFHTSICIPQAKPDVGEVWLLVLHELGHNWIQINIPPPPTQLC